MLKPPSGRAGANAFYGNPALPNGSLDPQWERENIVPLTLPFPLRYRLDDGDKFITLRTLRVHRKAAPAFAAALTAVWNHVRIEIKRKVGFDRETAFYDRECLRVLRGTGLDITAGTFNFRKIRGSRRAISTHAYGAAIDFDAEKFPLGSAARMPEWFVQCFTDVGFVYGGDFKGRKDPMHFQFARGI